MERAAWGITLLHLFWCALESRLQPKRRWAAKGSELRLPLLAGSLTGLVTLTALVDLDHRPLSVVTASLGLGILGVLLRATAIRTLGNAFLDGVDWGTGQERIREGVYRLRHPAELGTLMILAGTCRASGSSLSLALLILGVVPTSVARVLLEERACHC